MFNQLQLLVYILLLFLNITVYAEPIIGSCEGFEFPLDSKGNIDTTIPVRVLRQEAPLYQEVKSTDILKLLEFGEPVLPLKMSNPRQRIQVAKYGSSTPLGWVAERDLLCVDTPLTNEKNLPRKAFIKVPIDTDSKYRITAYPSPNSSQCNESNETSACRPLSRFEVYFIFAEEQESKRYLLAENYILSGPSLPPLIGWVNADETIPWNTRLGLRPKEAVERIQGYIDKNDKTLKGVVLEGGKIWYSFPYHIPLLNMDEKKEYYRVAAPGTGITGFKPPADQVLDIMKQVDVFFLLDGTASMAPYIEATKEAVQKITEDLHKHPEFKETSFRCGFRVYRDIYADSLRKEECQNGICEGVPLSSTTCQLETKEDNCQEVAYQIGKIRETKNDSDDYPERLFDGLRQSIRDMSACPQRTKLLFVIGDHGDERKTFPQDIVDSLNNNFDRKLLFFIQTLNSQHKARSPELYRKAYRSFQTQAFDIIDKILPKEYKGRSISPENYLLSLTKETELSQQTVDTISQWSNSAVVNDIRLRLRSGESLESIIEKGLQARKEEKKAPVMFWQWVDKTACEALGKQCEKPIEDRVTTFYIPIDKQKIQEEVVMIERHIDRWLKLLEPIAKLGSGLSATDQREEFIKLLKQEVQEVLGDPPLKEQGTLAEQLMKYKNGLPIYEKSPLLQYEIQEIRTMETCELARLIEWVRTTKDIFNKILTNHTLKVSFELKDYPNNCPNLSKKGKRIKQIVRFEQREKLGPDDSYRYGHALRGITLYWLPIEFMP